ncbi:recombinase family protein [Micromonospora sp. NPDC005291]|uniref:recombinase family protein n=1 Tax=Micromonospora sp. NPDC005291 TaxID=3156872 RepID=UPI0033B49719
MATSYHTGRFTKVRRLSKALRVLAPAAGIRIGYARCSTLTQELQSQLAALAAHRIPRDKIFAEKVSTPVRMRAQFEAALAGPADQGPRPAQPGHPDRQRDETPWP